MTVRPILRWPHKMLRTPAAPVAEITDEIRTIWDDMVDTMEAMPGWGLAAPQIGVGLRLAVLDVSDERGQAIRLANPEIVDAAPETGSLTEASPCLPGLSAKITRPATVSVAFTDAAGLRVRQDFTGNWAVSVQHQIDHLNGKMYVDRLSRTKRDMLMRKYKKAAT
ncbi:MAG: peptide deformylase [Pseudomonadota bacterium]